MSEPDWSSTELEHRLRVEMVDPLNHSDVLGLLDISESGASITTDLSTSTLSQASIECRDWSEWIENSWIRIVHEIPAYDFREMLGTYFVYDEGRSFEYGSMAASPTLYSSLKALSLDRIAQPVFIGEGARISAVLSAILDPFIEHTIAPSCGDYHYTSTYVLDAGDTKLDALQNTLAHVNWEYKLNGDGSIRFIPFIPYAARAIAYTIDSDASDSVILENTLRPEGTSRTSPGRSIVVWKGDNRDDEPVTAYADVGPDNPASPQRRGYSVSELHELSDMNGNRTFANAMEYAEQFLQRDAVISRKWTMDTLWLPLSIGDCISFRPPEEAAFIRAIVQSIRYNLSSWTLTLTVIEV